MSGRLENKVALVTGGTTGNGQATPIRIAQEGTRVFITGRRHKELDQAVAMIGNGSVGIQGDVSQTEDLDRLFAAVREGTGKLDILFLNAGIATHSTMNQVTEEEFDSTFSTNVRGVFFWMQ